MRIILSLFFVLLFAFLSAYLAKQRGRDPVAWFMIGILLGIFSPILLLILKPLSPGVEDEIEENEDAKLLPELQESNRKPYVDKEWFYLDQSHQQQGPIFFNALKNLWQEEKINPTTYVWSEGMDQWRRVGELPGFTDTLHNT